MGKFLIIVITTWHGSLASVSYVGEPMDKDACVQAAEVLQSNYDSKPLTGTHFIAYCDRDPSQKKVVASN